MNKFLMTALSAVGFALSMNVEAAENFTCYAEFAVANTVNQFSNVAFNIQNNSTIRTITILSGSTNPNFISEILCSDTDPFTISATAYVPGSMAAIGQCELAAGSILLSGVNNGVSVVYPNDFIVSGTTTPCAAS